jgi:hypothetical protein
MLLLNQWSRGFKVFFVSFFEISLIPNRERLTVNSGWQQAPAGNKQWLATNSGWQDQMGRYLEPVAALRTPNNPLVRSLHKRAVLRGMGDGPKRPLLAFFRVSRTPTVLLPTKHLTKLFGCRPSWRYFGGSTFRLPKTPNSCLV